MKALSILTHLFAHNWGLKLLSLTLAIVIYYALKPSDTVRSTRHDSKIFQTR